MDSVLLKVLVSREHRKSSFKLKAVVTVQSFQFPHADRLSGRERSYHGFSSHAGRVIDSNNQKDIEGCTYILNVSGKNVFGTQLRHSVIFPCPNLMYTDNCSSHGPRGPSDYDSDP